MVKFLKIYSFIVNVALKIGGAYLAVPLVMKLLDGGSLGSDDDGVLIVGIAMLILSFIKSESRYGIRALWIANITAGISLYLLAGAAGYLGYVLAYMVQKQFFGSISSDTASIISLVVGILFALVFFLIFQKTPEEEEVDREYENSRKPQPSSNVQSVEEPSIALWLIKGILLLPFKLIGHILFGGSNTGFSPSETYSSFNTTAPTNNYDYMEAERRRQEEFRRSNEAYAAEQKRLNDEYWKKKDQAYNYARYQEEKRNDPNEYYLKTRQFKYRSGR